MLWPADLYPLRAILSWGGLDSLDSRIEKYLDSVSKWGGFDQLGCNFASWEIPDEMLPRVKKTLEHFGYRNEKMMLVMPRRFL